MFKNPKDYLFIILIHILIGMAIYFAPVVSKIYGYAIIIGGLYYILKNKNANNEVLYVSGYIVGSEVFLRMTEGNPMYEFSKYSIIFFILIGMYFKGFSKNAVPYWIYLALLIPGIVLALYNLNYDSDIRKAISFNISGPLCLGLAALYTHNRKVTLEYVNNVMLLIGLPIISCTVYLIFYTPSIRDVITGTGSNFEASGGFGPNQVSTMLGLGMFIFLSRLMFSSFSWMVLVVNVVVALTISYRGLITFSRGGMLTGAVMLFLLIFITYFKINRHGRKKMNYLLILLVVGLIGTWLYSSLETGGLIEKRYQNQDAAGRVKESRFTGREQISASEIATFLENPVFGVGVGKGMEVRLAETGDVILSHNEITRMLAEHGSLGVMTLLILFCTPVFLYLDNKHHVYLFCFLFFWLLTINHAAMRLGAPAFVYALSILKIYRDEKPAVHRE